MNSDTILDRLADIEKLPSLPVVVSQINKLIASNNSNMAQISIVIARDQAIASRVIRLVNSAFYGLQAKVTSIQQAITLLGLNTVKNILMGVGIVRLFENGTASLNFDRHKFWLHSFFCAQLSKSIAKQRGCSNPEDFFIAGLLHDIGILVLDQFFHEEFSEIIEYCNKNNTLYFNAEKAVTGITHSMVGAHIAKQWHLPDILTSCIQFHHEPLYVLNEPSINLELLFTIHTSDVFAYKAGFDIGMQCAIPQPSQIVFHRLGINESVIKPLSDETYKTTASVMKEWGIPG